MLVVSLRFLDKHFCFLSEELHYFCVYACVAFQLQQIFFYFVGVVSCSIWGCNAACDNFRLRETKKMKQCLIFHRIIKISDSPWKLDLYSCQLAVQSDVNLCAIALHLSCISMLQSNKKKFINKTVFSCGLAGFICIYSCLSVS